MILFELQEILDEELKDPEFKASFEAEMKILAAERTAYEALLELSKNSPRRKLLDFSLGLRRAVA